MKHFTICLILLLICYTGISQRSSCAKDLEIVETAFNAFVTDSVNRSDYYFKAAKTAENILKNCTISEEIKKDIAIKRTMISLYDSILLHNNEMNLHLSPPNVKRFFNREIDLLKNITAPAYQPYVSYLKGIIYANILANNDSAIKYFKEALEAQPNWVPVLHAISTAYLSASKHDDSPPEKRSESLAQADEYLQKCFTLTKTYPQAYYTKACLTFDAKNFYGAVGYLLKALELDPLNPKFYFELGKRYEAVEISDTAEYYYKKGISVDPQYISAYLRLARIYRSQEENTKANNLYKKCREINPYLPEIYIGIGDLTSEEDQVNYYQQAVKLDSSYMSILGENNHNKGEYEDAIEIYRASMNYSPDKWVCRNIAACYYSLEKYKESVEFFEEALAFDSMYAEVHYWLGELYDGAAYTIKEKALYHFRKAFLLEPDNRYYAKRYFSLAILDILKNQDMRKTYEAFYDLYKNGCDSCLFYANGLKYEFGFDSEIDKEEAVEWYSIILRSTNSDFAWNRLLALSDVWEKRGANMEWNKNSSYARREINISCYKDADNSIAELPITLYENYPKGMHPLLWEALRIKKDFNANFFQEDRKLFMDYYNEAQRYNSPYPYYAFYRYRYHWEDQQTERFENYLTEINKENDPTKKFILLDTLIAKTEYFTKSNVNATSKKLLAKAYLLYGEILYEEGKKNEALEMLNKATLSAQGDTSIVNKTSSIKFLMYNQSINELIKVSTEEELATYIGFYLQKRDKKNADIIFENLISDDPTAKIRYLIFEKYLEYNIDMFNKLLLSDTNEDNIYKYRSYFTSSITNTTDYEGKVREYERLIKLDEKLLKISSDKTLRTEIAGNYNDFGWFAILSKDFAKAKMAIFRGLELDKTNVYLIGNEPHVLLLTGQTESAEKKYLELKNKIFIKGSALATFKDAFLADFKDFKNAEFSEEDLEKIENIKRKLTSK